MENNENRNSFEDADDVERESTFGTESGSENKDRSGNPGKENGSRSEGGDWEQAGEFLSSLFDEVRKGFEKAARELEKQVPEDFAFNFDFLNPENDPAAGRPFSERSDFGDSPFGEGVFGRKPFEEPRGFGDSPRHGRSAFGGADDGKRRPGAGAYPENADCGDRPENTADPFADPCRPPQRERMNHRMRRTVGRRAGRREEGPDFGPGMRPPFGPDGRHPFAPDGRPGCGPDRRPMFTPDGGPGRRPMFTPDGRPGCGPDGRPMFTPDGGPGMPGCGFPADRIDYGEVIEIVAALPGFDKNNISVLAKGDELVVKAVRDWRETPNTDKYTAIETPFGTFERHFPIGPFDPDSVRAAFKDGLLHISVNKRSEPEGKTISVE